ncbi:GSCOCG00010759001-RA-CDS [Cotesia congregata]|uniref:Similar to Dzip1l: Zinc finger protein DZIP1L (Mus musculus) n=1 Tax=Cotesia congregata TaxID=51543 RepID=A0A8J2HHB9_COTCN|nr:GSCOCG00010759001-RA-CDS [Cotesia congregata]CAG5097651.1 Similar to Dzip1l: Zinc finger protein DZIP1L (Mus musculus) [Cotesia congregata]
MAFSLRAGTNWCHDFPKLARESGFYFNVHRNKVRVDWNRIGSIDIDRLIRERDFSTIDENINNVVDYNLESEYDIKILDPNFVKLFRLAQLSVEYLLYCKQYLDHSVIILKDELRLKLEDNVKLKKNLAAAEESVKELKEKLRENYKLFEKTLTDSRGEVHKCPYCPKSFKSAIFTNLHINRRHSNSPQVSILSPVHDQYKAETEKLHNEIKTLKERLNQTERIVRNESSKLYESIEQRDRDIYEKNNNQDKIEEEHRKYREEISNLTSMLFSEIKNLKIDDKKSQVDETEKFKRLLKSQEDELTKLRDQVQELSLDKSKPDIESIQIKLKAQEEYWQAKLNQLEDQHAKDIQKLSNQLQITQDSTMLIRDDYVSKIRDLEERSLDSGRWISPKISPARRRRRAENFVTSLVERERPSEFNKLNEVDRTDSDESVNKLKKILVTSAEVHNVSQQKVVGFKNDTVLGKGGKEINFNSWTVKDVDIKKLDLKNDVNIKKLDQRNDVDIKKLDQSIEKKFNVKDSFKPIASCIKEEKNRMDISSESESESGTSLESASLRSESGSETGSESESEDEKTESEEKIPVKNLKAEDDKTKKDIKRKVWEDFEQKLRDLGIDPDCDEISEEIYKRSMEMVKHHRNLSARKFGKFEEIRRKILNQLHDKFPRNEVRKSPLRKLVSSVKSRAVKAFSNPSQAPSQEHVPKLKAKVMSPERSVSNKFNMELLPKKISQQELPVRRASRDGNPMSPGHERYTPSPSKNNAKPFSPEPIVDTKLSHSYESIKDYMRDFGKKSSPGSASASGSPLRSPYLSKVLATSTPHRAEINVLPSHRASVSDLSSPVAKLREFSLPSSPKNSKSVLKTASGSTGSLVKKKVLFDLEPMTDTSEKIDKLETNGVISSSKNKVSNEDDDSESDYEISSISEEKSDSKILEPVNNSSIVLKTSQSEKIAQISRKIESQLSLTRHKPAGAVEAMFKGFNLHDEDDDDGSLAGFSVDRNNVNVQSFNKVIKLPQPTPRTQRIRVSSPDKSAEKDFNLDNDIDEILNLD